MYYTFFFETERITFHIHNNLCRGFFEKGVGADSVPLIGYAVYDLIYHTKLYYSVLWPINQFLHLIFYWWIYIRKKEKKPN